MENCNDVNPLLDMWSKNHVDNTIVDMMFVKGESVIGSGGGQITLSYKGSTDDYLDLSETYLDVKVALTSATKQTDLDALKYNVGPVNNLFHSLFSAVDIEIETTPVEKCTNYQYQAYITEMLNRGSGSKQSELQAQLFYKDTHTKFDSLITFAVSSDNPPVTTHTSDNDGLKLRASVFSASKNIVQLRGRLRCDIFNMNKLFLNNLNLTIKLSQTNSLFRLMKSTNTDFNFNLSIQTADVYFKKIRPSRAVIESNAAKILKQPVVYPITRTKTDMHVIPSGIQSFEVKLRVGGQIPNRITIGMVKNSAYTGTENQNPFNFEHFKVSSMSMTVAGENRPFMEPLRFEWDNNNYLAGYSTLFEGMDSNLLFTGNYIQRAEYPDGNFFVVFNLFKKFHNEYNTIFRSGTVNLNLVFATALSSALSLIAVSEFDTQFDINNDKSIKTYLM